MRILLFTGKGGVGKTTSAAAEAVRAARAGIRTVVLSTDTAHSLGDTLGVGLVDGVLTEVEPRLDALQSSPAASVEPAWRVVQDYLLGVIEGAGLDPVIAEELTSLPGADELAALGAVRGLLDADAHDLLVVDCAPSAETLRLLALPEILAWHLSRLLPAQRALIGAMRPRALAAAGIPAPPAEVVETVVRWQEQMRRIHGVLTSPATSVRLVLTPESVVLAETRRTLTSLSLYGYVVDAAVVNRIVPDAGRHGEPDPWLAAWNAEQQRVLADVEQVLDGIPVVRAPFRAGEPVGVEALAELAEEMDRSELPGEVTDPAAAPTTSVAKEGEHWVLRLPLPHVTSADVRLSRREDDLVVDVHGAHRVVTLPSVLRRCTVAGARVRAGVLAVDFVPDPEVWPRER